MGLGPPGFRLDTTVGLRLSDRQYRPIAGLKPGVGSPALAVRRTAPAGGAKRGPPHPHAMPEGTRVTESVGPSTWAGRLAGAILDGLPGTTLASPCASERPRGSGHPGPLPCPLRAAAWCPGHSGRLWQRHRLRAGRRVQRDARAPVAGAAPLGGPPRCGPHGDPTVVPLREGAGQ